MVARRAKNCTGVMGSALPNQSPGCWHFRHAGICTAIGHEDKHLQPITPPHTSDCDMWCRLATAVAGACCAGFLPFDKASLYDRLQSGEVLCNLVRAVDPSGSVATAHVPRPAEPGTFFAR